MIACFKKKDLFWIMTNKIRWGILGTGRIARAFAEGLKHTANGELLAIASRTKSSADSFAYEWNIDHAFSSYEEMTHSEKIDAIYIATPHTEHAQNAIACMENGKAVLCEKPFAVNKKQVFEMIEKSREKNVLLMEGMWSRFPPLMHKVRKIINDGGIGEIRTIQADFGFKPEKNDPEGRLLNPSLAGGSLLDVGIYPVSLSFMLNGKPDSFQTDWTRGPTGIDEQASIIFKYSNGSMALLHSSLQSDTNQQAFISGTEGSICIHKQCWRPQQMTLIKSNKSFNELIEMPFQGNGFNYEAEHFGQLLIDNKKESPIMPLSESLEIISILDQIRKKWDLKYPFE